MRYLGLINGDVIVARAWGPRIARAPSSGADPLGAGSVRGRPTRVAPCSAARLSASCRKRRKAPKLSAAEPVLLARAGSLFWRFSLVGFYPGEIRPHYRDENEENEDSRTDCGEPHRTESH